MIWLCHLSPHWLLGLISLIGWLGKLHVQLKRTTFSNRGGPLFDQGYMSTCTPLLGPPDKLSRSICRRTWCIQASQSPDTSPPKNANPQGKIRLFCHRVCVFIYPFLLFFFFFFFTVPGLSCSMWDLVAQPGIKPRPPSLGAQSLSHRGSPCHYVFLRTLGWLLGIGDLTPASIW